MAEDTLKRDTYAGLGIITVLAWALFQIGQSRRDRDEASMKHFMTVTQLREHAKNGNKAARRILQQRHIPPDDPRRR
jgi:hypothetical protein